MKNLELNEEDAALLYKVVDTYHGIVLNQMSKQLGEKGREMAEDLAIKAKEILDKAK